jgi:glycosyltransferase involved in cell wall biosynthesis
MTLSRIAYIVNVFPKLSETFIAGELAELRRRGVEILILSLRRPTEILFHRILEEAGLLERVVYDSDDFARVLREFQPQILHAHFATEPAAWARELSGEFGIPFTFTAHGYDIYRRPPPDFAERAAAAGAVITVSRANGQYIAEHFNIPRSHLQVIPCGVDIQRFRPNFSNGIRKLEAVAPLIVCVARLVPVKNLELLLVVCAELLARRVNFRCVLVGDGVMRDKLLADRARLGLETTVDLVGAAEQDAVLGWWQRAAVAVLTSEREGMPVSLMEAAACGVPAVATAVGGIPELVKDGVTGVLVPPGSRDAFVVALERLLKNADMAFQMGLRARQRIVQRFSIRRQVDHLIELWNTFVRTETNLCQLR